MTNIEVVNQYGLVAEGSKFPTWQDFVTWLEKNHSSYVPGNYSLYNYGNTVPAVDDQDRPWMRTNADGSPDKLYFYYNGAWVSPHSVPASGSERRLWVGTLVALRSYDGGDGTADPPTATSGAMWEEDTSFRDKIPMGVLDATGQVQTPLATAGALTDDITITADSLPRHRHEISIESATVGEAESSAVMADPDSTGRLKADGGSNTQWNSSEDSDLVGYTRYYGNAAANTTLTVDILPPVVGCYMIKRTARVYYTV